MSTVQPSSNSGNDYSNLTTPLNIQAGLQSNVHQGLHPSHGSHQPSPNYQQPTPWTISESESHFPFVFDRLRVQREQSRFADLILSVRGREFAAHRCVMAACSPWFDARLKVHKSTREHIAIDQCKDYEIFYALLTYCYTGNIQLDQHNVPELLSLSVLFQMVKLKSYCCEYLWRNLNCKTIHLAVDLAIRHQASSDLIRRSFAYLHSSFRYLFEHDREELLQYSPSVVQAFLSDKGWVLPPELVLKYAASWVNYDLSSREEYFVGLLYCINWGNINTQYLAEHLNDDPLYQNSQEALFNILSVLDRNNIYLGPRFQEIYQSLQATVDLDELNDSNSFLSMAINSAVKDLEHSEVDTNFFLENDPFRPQQEQQHQTMGPPPPPPPLMVSSQPHQEEPTISKPEETARAGYSNRQQQQQQTLVSAQVPSSSSIMSHHQYSYSNTISNNSSTVVSSKSEKLEKFKDSFEFEIVEQLINEQQQSDAEKHKYTSSSSVKRYDPKYRALNEAFRQMEDVPKATDQEETPISKPEVSKVAYTTRQQPQTGSGSQQPPSSKYPLPKQRHLSSEPQHPSRQGMHNMPQRVTYEVSLNPMERSQEVEENVPPSVPFWPAQAEAPEPAGAAIEAQSMPEDQQQKNSEPELEPSPPASPLFIVPSPPPASNAAIVSATNKEFPIQSQKKLASKERRAKAVAMMEENANATLDPKPVAEVSSQKQHVRKAKLLAEHRETLQRSTSQEDESVVKFEVKKELLASSVADTAPSGAEVVAAAVVISETNTNKIEKSKSKEKKKSNIHRCPICGHSSKAKLALYKHLSEAHLLEPPFKCMHAGCSFQTSKLQILLNHDNVHSIETLFHCPQSGCDFKAMTMHHMKFHKISHSDKVYPCHKCDKKFNHKSSLNTHLLVHETVKKLNCTHCNFTTKYKNHLTTHMRIHTGDVLRCDQCSYTTPKKSLMTAHERAHKKIKMFKCDICAKAFVENSALTRHKRIHSDELPFACTVCSFKTRRRDKLKHHLLKKHPNADQN